MFRSSLMPTQADQHGQQPRRQTPRERDTRRTPPQTQGQCVRTALLRNPNRTPELNANIDRLTAKLDQIPPPPGTKLRIILHPNHRITLFWENVITQHCIQLDIDLNRMEADYEYSMVCEDHDELLPFPDKPLGATQPDRAGLSLHRQATWTWLKARLRATEKYLSTSPKRRPPPQEQNR